MSPSQFNKWRIIPRLLILCYGAFCFYTGMWFMELPEPTTQQTAFTSTIWGGAALWFNFYTNTGKTDAFD